MFYFILTFVFIFGLVIGSFLNCLIWRLHTGESLGSRSYCPNCRHQINWYDNIPLFSFLFLRGRCRYCGQKISPQYPLVELAAGLLFSYSFYLYYASGSLNYLEVVRDWFIIAVLLVVFVYDLKWQLILDKVMLPAIFIVAGINLFLGTTWWILVISAIIGGGFFFLQFVVSRGMWIGGGDIRLGIFMGAALAKISTLILALFSSYLLGSVVGIALIISGKKKWGSKIPLGVFLAIGTIFALFWGNSVVEWYLGILG